MRIRELAIVATFLMLGCGHGGPKLAPVTGTVLLNGNPFEGAVVMFSPDPTNKEGLPSVVITGPEGKYTAVTRERPGLVPGKYKVAITKAPAKPLGETIEVKEATPPAGTLMNEFDREVPPEGGEIDFDVKGKLNASGAITGPRSVSAT